MRRGKLITFEGGDKVGKTTQIELLSDYLTKKNYDVSKVEEPGGTKIGREIRRILLESSEDMRPETELFLFEASRSELIEKVIIPNLDKGRIILSDRFYDSSVAYQGYGGGVNIRLIEYLNKVATKGISPDLTILIDIGGLEIKSTGEFDDRIEKKVSEFHKKVNRGYLELAKKYPERIKVVKYIEGEPLEMHKKICRIVKPILKND